MNKTDKLNELFEKWNDGSFEVFCEDGIVDENSFRGYKILFVLKDLHLDEKNSDEYKKIGKIDMRRHVCDKEDWRTWNPIALWSKALLDKDVKEFQKIQSEISDKIKLRENYLPRVAFMNIKKEAGKSSVANECVLCYSEKYAQYIKNEIKIIDPDIIIACGPVVFQALRKFVYNDCNIDDSNKIEFNEKMRDYGNVLNISSENNNVKSLYVIEYRHPVDFGRGSCTSEEHYNNMLKIKESFLK